MTTDKRWTYKQITDKAEEQIRRILKMADDAPPIAYLHRESARGVYDMWYELTCGWQDDGDSARLRAMIDSHRDLEREAANRS